MDPSKLFFSIKPLECTNVLSSASSLSPSLLSETLEALPTQCSRHPRAISSSRNHKHRLIPAHLVWMKPQDSMKGIKMKKTTPSACSSRPTTQRTQWYLSSFSVFVLLVLTPAIHYRTGLEVNAGICKYDLPCKFDTKTHMLHSTALGGLLAVNS